MFSGQNLLWIFLSKGMAAVLTIYWLLEGLVRFTEAFKCLRIVQICLFVYFLVFMILQRGILHWKCEK